MLKSRYRRNQVFETMVSRYQVEVCSCVYNYFFCELIPCGNQIASLHWHCLCLQISVYVCRLTWLIYIAYKRVTVIEISLLLHFSIINLIQERKGNSLSYLLLYVSWFSSELLILIYLLRFLLNYIQLREIQRQNLARRTQFHSQNYQIVKNTLSVNLCIYY